MADLRFEIIQHLGVIGEGSKGWKTEANIVSWNDREPKLDIRAWNEAHTHMGKGIALTSEEAQKLAKILTKHFKK